MCFECTNVKFVLLTSKIMLNFLYSLHSFVWQLNVCAKKNFILNKYLSKTVLCFSTEFITGWHNFQNDRFYTMNIFMQEVVPPSFVLPVAPFLFLNNIHKRGLTWFAFFSLKCKKARSCHSDFCFVCFHHPIFFKKKKNNKINKMIVRERMCY